MTGVLRPNSVLETGRDREGDNWDLSPDVVRCKREILKLIDYINPFLEATFTHPLFFLFILQELKLGFEPCHGCLHNNLLEGHSLHTITHESV